MKKFILFAGLLACSFSACLNDGTENNNTNSHKAKTVQLAGLEIDLEANPEWQYENLRLYPVFADEQVLLSNASLPELKSLAEGMETAGFRITERKQFGRERSPWYNALTVQNKSKEMIFLMSGDVVTGGNQDRVIAYDDVIPPGTIKNIEVFCVEAGRSSYYNPEAPETEKRVAAFSGYYNVASPQVRNAVYQGNQQGVWNAVEAVTKANNASSETQTYAALDNANEQKAKREAYLQFFEDKFADRPNTVGLVAVCQGKVIGVDIFGQTGLFQRQYPALLHGYAAESISAKQVDINTDLLATKVFQKVAAFADTSDSSSEEVGKFAKGEAWVHLYKK